MARGRMINSKITRNKAINDLSDDTSRLAFTWLVTFADVEGRTNGDPALVRSLVFPRRTDVTVEQMDGYIREWADAGLILWYEADGDMWIAFPAFEENQRGLDRRKEPGSDIPAPTADVPSPRLVRTEHVPSTYQVRSNRTEQNRSEVKYASEAESLAPPEPEQHNTDDTLVSLLFSEVDRAGIILSSSLSDQYVALLDDVRKMPEPERFLSAVFDEARKAGARPLPPWLTRVTDRCVAQGCMPGEWTEKRAPTQPRASPPRAAPPEITSFRNPITGEVERI